MSRALLVVAAVAAPLAAAAETAGPETSSGERGTVMTLSLDDAIAAALRWQPSLHQARATVELGEARVEEARAPQLPQVALSALAERTTGNGAPRPGFTQAPVNNGWSAPTFNYFSLGATATQLIYDFGQTPERWRAASAARDASEFSAKATETQVIAAVRRAYFQVRAQKDLVKVAAEAVANQEKHVAQTEGLVAQGLRPAIDRARARTDLANARVQWVGAQNNDANAHALLAQAIGLQAGQAVDVTEEEAGPVAEEDFSLPKLVELALRERPETAAYAKQRRAQEALLRAARGGYGPTLSAQAGATLVGLHVDELVPNWYVEGVLSWPIFQGFLTHGQVREASANLRIVEAQEEAFRASVRVDVETAALAVHAAKSNLVASQEALTNAKEQLRLAEGRYAAGLGSAIELGDAQVAATQAAAQEVGNRFALATARATLAGALGKR